MPGATANIIWNTRLENFFLEGGCYRTFHSVSPKLHRDSDKLTYDSHRKLLLTQTIDGLTPVIALSYELSALGQVEQLSASIGGVNDFINTYDYDDLGRLNWVKQTDNSGYSVADKRVDFTYDATSRYDTITRYADLSATDLVATGTYTFDPLGRLTDLIYHKDSTTLSYYNYAYDAAGNMTWMETIDGEVDYTLDDTNQLTDADYVGDWQSDEDYDYDENGNRTNNGYVTGTNNQLLEDGTYRYAYDAEGNRTLRYVDTDGSDTLTSGDTDITEYEWDHRNRLTEVEHFTTYTNYGTDTSDQIVSYTYDCFNQLISRTLDTDGTSGATAIEQSIYINEGGQIIAQFDKTGTGDLAATDMSHRYLWNPQAVDQLFSDEQIHYDGGFVTDELLWALTDHQNTVRDGVTYDSVNDSADIRIHRIFDAFGQMTDEDLFDANGNAVTSGQAGAIDEPFKHTGTLRDEATGLDKHGVRWYEASTGRWASEDKIWDGTNLYAYVGNNPATNTDSSGYCKDDGGGYRDLVYRGEDAGISVTPFRYDTYGSQTWSYANFRNLVYRGEAMGIEATPFRLGAYSGQMWAYANYSDLVHRGEAGSYQRGPHIAGTGGVAMYVTDHTISDLFPEMDDPFYSPLKPKIDIKRQGTFKNPDLKNDVHFIEKSDGTRRYWDDFGNEVFWDSNKGYYTANPGGPVWKTPSSGIMLAEAAVCIVIYVAGPVVVAVEIVDTAVEEGFSYLTGWTIIIPVSPLDLIQDGGKFFVKKFIKEGVEEGLEEGIEKGLKNLPGSGSVDTGPYPDIPTPKVPEGPSIHPGKQGKHIPGENNFIPGRSELTHPDPQGLLNRGAGRGSPANNIPRGQPGFKERVDFGEVIGNYTDPVTGAKMPTTKGIIHYAKDGSAHIIPARP